MTEYIYQVRSNTPLAAVVGMGNQPTIIVGQYGMGLVDHERVESATSNGAVASDGHRITLELLERYEPTEWEYGVQMTDGAITPNGMSLPAAERAATAWVGGRVVRRRAAGAWSPVHTNGDRDA